MKNRKTAAALLLVSLFLLTTASLVNAQDFGKIAEGGAIQNTSDLQNLIVRIIRWMQYIFYLVAIIFIIITAFNFLTSKGEPEKVKKAKASLIYSVIAIAIAIVGAGFILIIKDVMYNK